MLNTLFVLIDLTFPHPHSHRSVLENPLMNTTTKLVAGTAAFIMTTCALADLEYGSAILTAQSACDDAKGSQAIKGSLDQSNRMEAHAHCQSGMSSASVETGDDYFVLAAGSNNSGAQKVNENNKKAKANNNPYASVEFMITVDRPTLFTMDRAIADSHVKFWSGSDLLDSLNKPGEQTALREGQYWVTIETDQYGTPTWAEISWWQNAGEPADLNKDGQVDQKDLIVLVSEIKKSANEKQPSQAGKKQYPAKHPTNVTKGGLSKPASKPNQADKVQPNDKRYHINQPVKVGSAKTMADKQKGAAKQDWTPLPRPKPNCCGDKPMKGDLNNDKKVNMKDLILLLKRL